MRFKVKDGSIVEDQDAPQSPEGARRPVVRFAGNGKLVVTFPFGWNGELDITATQDPAQTDKDLSLVEPGDLTKRGYPIDPPKLNWEPFKLPQAPGEERPAMSGGFGPSQEEIEADDEGPITFMGPDDFDMGADPTDSLFMGDGSGPSSFHMGPKSSPAKQPPLDEDELRMWEDR